MFLFACIRAKTISCVHSEINEITGHSFAALAHIGWFWFSAPLNPSAILIAQFRIKPLHADLLITSGVRAVMRGLCSRRLPMQTDNATNSKREVANQPLRRH